MISALRAFLLTVLILPFFAACGNKLPEASDAQILALFGEPGSPSNDSPLVIPKQTDECFRVLSGLDDAIYKDMPAMLGMLNSECRTSLANVLDDGSKNVVGFTLEHLKDPHLAARISRIAAEAEARSVAFAKAAEQRQQLEKILARDKKITEAKAKLEKLMASLDQRFVEIDALCSTWEQEHAFAKERKRSGGQSTPKSCHDEFKLMIREAVAQTLVKLTFFQSEGGNPASSKVPYSRLADETYLADQVDDLNARIDDLRASKG